MEKKKSSSKSLIYLIPVAFTLLLILSWLWLAGIIPFASNDNLLLGTNKGTGNYLLLSKGYDAVMKKEGKGINLSVTPEVDGSEWIVAFYDDHNSCTLLSEPKGEFYTLSFEAKANIEGVIFEVSHRQSDYGNNQVDFGTAVISEANTWNTFVLSGEVLGVPATSQGIYFNLTNNNIDSYNISIRNLCLVKGKAA